MSYNTFSGTIPTQIGQLTRLLYLSLQNNQLEGAVPLIFSNCPLIFLSLSNNKFSSFSYINIPTLSILYLANNHLNEVTGLFPSLNSIDLSNNMLTEFSPDLYFDALQTLKLNNNNIKMALGDFIYTINRYTNLQQIDISFNQFYINAPLPIFAPPVTSLKLSYNNITTHLDHIFTAFNTLTELDINNNNIFGTIPSNIPTTLNTLNIHNTLISGTLPVHLGSIPLQSIDISNTLLCGSFPSQWNNFRWNYCNLNIPYYCNSTVPMGCSAPTCDENTMCNIDQCQTGTHKCHNGRHCQFNSNKWSYTCSNCNEKLYFTEGEYNCKPGYVIILTPILIIVVLFIIGAIIYIRKKTSEARKEPLSMQYPDYD